VHAREAKGCHAGCPREIVEQRLREKNGPDEDARLLLSKLHQEAARLRADVVRLAERIEPFDDTPPPYVSDAPPATIRSNTDIVGLLTELRNEMRTSEHHLSAIRGRIDEIAADAILRDELKPWIKSRTR
jgi:phage shock protein A